MQGSLGRNVALGFVAAAIAVITVHQAMVWLLTAVGMTRLEAWSLRGVPPYGVPRLINAMFWGGLWGALFALVWDKIPGAALWLKGLIYGLIIAIASNFILVPLIKGRVFGVRDQVFFGDGDPKRIMVTILLQLGFGAMLGLVYGLLTKRA